MENKLIERIRKNLGVNFSEVDVQYRLAGFFNRYRPDGEGLKKLLAESGVEGEVLSRIQKIFLVTAPHWRPSDLYFVIRRYDYIKPQSALEIVQNYLEGFGLFAEHNGDSELASILKSLKFTSKVSNASALDDDVSLMMYECLTDFLAVHQENKNELFLLKEALYSMANDYFLLAYALWPAMNFSGNLRSAFDSYFDVWRYGIRIQFFKGGHVSVELPS
ncbi:hypothetical protein Hrubri_1560 [Herbaspirillum rubrisubalbicans M1]|uniref:hypothetical protein n=1 Tax=Herbaspirillum rubrisubalbicans TaxID=80842 RepID=UPI00073A20B1|nr:hypothetical protein [Herbaspirillum rubrisubalbicans]ALU88769.1 hypothetical protein Hrubri_1560 [Herbaspirillum rubrisubalbicans M1]